MTSDPQSVTNVNGMGLNLNVGIWYSMVIGMPGHLICILTTEGKMGKFNGIRTFQFIVLTGGLSYKLQDPKYVLKPAPCSNPIFLPGNLIYPRDWNMTTVSGADYLTLSGCCCIHGRA